MPLEAYRLPDYFALLPEKPGGEINPHFKEAEIAFNAWVDKWLDGTRAAEVHRCDNPRAGAFLFPRASKHQLKAIINYSAAGLLVDDILDRSTSENALVVSKLWMKALRGDDEGEAIPHPVIELIRNELLHDLKAVIDPVIWPQFMVTNEKIIAYMAQEMHKRPGEVSTALDIRSYMDRRRWSIGVDAAFPLIRASGCLYIPDDVLENQVVQEMESTTAKMRLIGNDVYSFKKEYAFDEASNNLLTAIQRDPETAHLDFQGRLDYTGKLMKDAVSRFNVCRRKLPSFNPEMDRYLDLYADGMIDLVVGNVQWSQVNRRYDMFANEEDRKNNIVRLDLG